MPELANLVGEIRPENRIQKISASNPIVVTPPPPSQNIHPAFNTFTKPVSTSPFVQNNFMASGSNGFQSTAGFNLPLTTQPSNVPSPTLFTEKPEIINRPMQMDQLASYRSSSLEKPTNSMSQAFYNPSIS